MAQEFTREFTAGAHRLSSSVSRGPARSQQIARTSNRPHRTLGHRGRRDSPLPGKSC